MLSGITWTGEGGVFTDLYADLLIVIPVALVVLATLWGLRLAISYLKGIAR